MAEAGGARVENYMLDAYIFCKLLPSIADAEDPIVGVN